MIFGKSEARAKYTVWAKIKALSPPDRRRLVNDNGESNWLSLLTPTQYAQLFPDYYKKALPDIGNHQPLVLVERGLVTQSLVVRVSIQHMKEEIADTPRVMVVEVLLTVQKKLNRINHMILSLH